MTTKFSSLQIRHSNLLKNAKRHAQELLDHFRFRNDAGMHCRNPVTQLRTMSCREEQSLTVAEVVGRLHKVPDFLGEAIRVLTDQSYHNLAELGVNTRDELEDEIANALLLLSCLAYGKDPNKLNTCCTEDMDEPETGDMDSIRLKTVRESTIGDIRSTASQIWNKIFEHGSREFLGYITDNELLAYIVICHHGEMSLNEINLPNAKLIEIIFRAHWSNWKHDPGTYVPIIWSLLHADKHWVATLYSAHELVDNVYTIMQLWIMEQEHGQAFISLFALRNTKTAPPEEIEKLERTLATDCANSPLFARMLTCLMNLIALEPAEKQLV